MAPDKNAFAGNTTLLILSLLDKKDLYGYKMIEELDQLSNHLFDLKAGTIYPILHSLEEKCLVTSYESTENAKKRKYYTITKQGRQFLNQKKQEWEKYSQAVNHVLGGSSIESL